MNRAIEQADFDAVSAKHDGGYDAMRAHFAKIREADALLVCNFTKKGIDNYIGANTFLEMGYAYSLELPIYTYNPLPDQPYINY
jgi:nucleoside 2-deoxyribosyltransferase